MTGSPDIHGQNAVAAQAPSLDRASGPRVGRLALVVNVEHHASRSRILGNEPEYRQSDRDEVLECLKKQGGLDHLSLAFYRQDDLGNDRVWDIWRLEGPAFVWHFRGAPHVHVWVNVADDPAVKLNA